MLGNENIQRFINADVKSRAHGSGHVIKLEIKGGGKYYITVLFDKDEDPRTFLASLAFSRDVFSFCNDEYNIEMQRLLAEEKLAERSVIKPNNNISKPKPIPVPAKGKSFNFDSGISSNAITNALVRHVLNDEAIALELIAHYDDENYEKVLCEEAFKYLERSMSGGKISEPQKACIVCALSLIALKYYDGDLHSYIEEKFREYRPLTENDYTRISIQNAVYKAIINYRKKTKYFDPHSYVAVPIVLSCVPHYRLPDLFKISYDIYKQKLLFDEDVSDEQIEEKVLETFKALNRNDLISDSDQIKGTNYLMSKYTQSCIYSGFGIDALSSIVARCIRLIISYLTRPEDSFRIEPYYLEGYTAWVNNFESDDKEKERYEKNRTISQPYFRLINNEVHLFTGEFNMDETYDANDVHICINKGDEQIVDLHITDPNSIEYVDENSAMSGYIIKRQEIALYISPLDNLSYQVVCCDQVLYDSKARLYRNNIFFDGKGHEVKPGTSYSGEVFVISHNSNEEEYGENITLIEKADDYYLSVVEINDHELFYFDGEPYTFYKISSAQIISYDTPWGEFISVEGKKYPIYRDITILFPASCDMEDIHLEIDGQDYFYGDPYDVYYKIRVYSKEYDGWAYTVRIYGLEPGYHTIKIFNDISDKQVKGANFGIVYDPDIWKAYKSNDGKGVQYELTCDFIKEQDIFYEYGTTYKEIHAFVKGLGHGNLAIYPSSICYSVNGESWFDIHDNRNKFYLCDIPESIKSIMICGPSNMTAYVLNPTENVKKQEISFETLEDDPRTYMLYISLLRTLLKKNKARILLEYNNRSRYMDVWYNPLVKNDECHFYFNEVTGKHYFMICYEGNSKVKVVIQPLHSDTAILEKPISSGDVIELDDSDIDKKVKYLSVSLRGRKYGSLFDQFQKEPFKTFPKYDLGRGPSVRLDPFPPVLRIKNNILSCNFGFTGTAAIKAELIPTAFNTPLAIKTLREGDTFDFDIKWLPFNSYKLYLYSAKDLEGKEFNETPIWYSNPVKITSPYLQKNLSVSAFILEDGTRVKASYSIWFKTIVEINHNYYLNVTLKSKTSGKVKENVACEIKKVGGLKYEAEIHLIEGDYLKEMRLNNGKTVKGIVIEQIGGWA